VRCRSSFLLEALSGHPSQVNETHRQVLNNDEDDDATSLICSINDADNKVQIVDLLRRLLKRRYMIMNLHVARDSRSQIDESCLHALHDEDDDEALDENIDHDEICS